MRGKQLYYFLVLIFLIILVASGFGLYYAVFANLGQSNQLTNGIRNETPQGAESRDARVELLFSNGKLFLKWDHLPPDAKIIKISRAQKGGRAMSIWKSIVLPSAKDSSIQIESGRLEDLNNYEYSFEIGSDQDRLFSSSTGIKISTSSFGPSPQTGYAEPENKSIPAPSPVFQKEGSSASSFSIPQQNIPSDFSLSPAGQTAPSGQIPPSSSTPAPNFWVTYVNQKIEFGWQNLPTSTTLIKLLRSKGPDGTWSQILKQTNPILSEPYKLHIVDQGQNENFYYKLQSYSGSQLIESYGPIYLPSQ